jgi:hypothetical protein
VVINTHEEYVLFRVLGYRPGDQSLMNKDGHAYDVMKVKSVEDGTDATFYFNVDIPIMIDGYALRDRHHLSRVLHQHL